MNITARAWSEQGEGASDAELGEAASDALEGVAKHLDGGVAKHLEGGVVATLRRVVEGSTGEDAVGDVVVEIFSGLSSGVSPRRVVRVAVEAQCASARLQDGGPLSLGAGVPVAGFPFCVGVTQC